MNTEIIREALTEAKEAMMWELGGEPIWSLTEAARLKIEEALTALDDYAICPICKAQKKISDEDWCSACRANFYDIQDTV